MPICPQCNSENLNTDKFCQGCGASLANTVSDFDVELLPTSKNSKSTSSLDATVLWAIITPAKEIADSILSKTKKGKARQLEIKSLADFFNYHTTNRANLERYVFTSQYEMFVGTTLDSHRTLCLKGKIIDRQPLQSTNLATLRQQQQKVLEKLRDNFNNSYLSNSQFWHSIGFPVHAVAYLSLERYFPVTPKIYEVWQQANGEFVLLEDRSEYQLLTELWSQEELSLSQILEYLEEMAKLWAILSQIGCSRSLLIEANLRVNENRKFCLQQLFMDEPQSIPNFKNLARVWQIWSNKLQGNYRENLERIFNRVVSGEIQDVEQLRLQLQSLDPELEKYQESIDNSFFEDENDFDPEDQATITYSMQVDSVVDAGYTNVGSQRESNEDFFAIETSTVKQQNNTDKNFSFRGLYVVCDGMGGHAAGEIASAMAVETLSSYFQTHWQDELPDRDTIEAGILLANDTIYQTNLKNSRSGIGRMGTTLVLALLHNSQLAIAHVGDSRIYQVTRSYGLQQLTIDHEVGQREVNRGVEPDIAYARSDAYQLTQALGPRGNKYIKPEIQFLEITEDCLLLLCSDGLCDRNLIENHWQEYLEPLISSNANLDEGLYELVNFADQHNGHDNITGVSIKIKLKPEF